MPGMQLGVADSHELAKVGNHFQRLLALDQVWTNHLDHGPSTGAAPQNEDLRTLTSDLDSAYADAASGVKWLLQLIDSQPQQFEQIMTEGLASLNVSPDQKQRFAEAAKRQGGFVPFAKSTLNNLTARIPVERTEVQRKLKELERGGNPPGDMDKTTECAIITATCCTCILLGAIPLAGGALAGFFARGCLDQ